MSVSKGVESSNIAGGNVKWCSHSRKGVLNLLTVDWYSWRWAAGRQASEASSAAPHHSPLLALLPEPLVALSSMKLVLGAKKVGDNWCRGLSNATTAPECLPEEAEYSEYKKGGERNTCAGKVDYIRGGWFQGKILSAFHIQIVPTRSSTSTGHNMELNPHHIMHRPFQGIKHQALQAQEIHCITMVPEEFYFLTQIFHLRFSWEK